MKRVKMIRLLSLALAVLTVACTDAGDEERQNQSQPLPIRLGATAVVKADTRGAVMQQDASFDTGTELDVFITDLSRQIDYDQPKVYSVSGSEVVDAVTYNTLETTPKQYYGNGSISIKAWYPKGFADGSPTGVVDFTVNAVQGSSDNGSSYSGDNYQSYRACDLMAASVSSQEPVGKPVNLPFRHLMARLVVLVEFYNGYTKENIKSINIKAVRGAKVDKDALTVTASGDVDQVVISGEDEDLGVCLLPPQTLTAGETLVEVILDDDLNPNRVYYKPSSALTLVAGNTYYLKLNTSTATITGYVDESDAAFTSINAWPDPTIRTNGESSDSDAWDIVEEDYVKRLLGEIMVELSGSYSIDGLEDTGVKTDATVTWHYDDYNVDTY